MTTRDGPPLPAHVAEPPREDRGQHRTHRESGGEDAHGDRAAAQHQHTKGGIEHARLAERHGGDVDEERRPDVRGALEEREPLTQRLEPGLLDLALGQDARQPDDAHEGGDEEHDVDGVGPAVADRGHEHAGERGPERHHDADRDAVERGCCRQQLAGEDARVDGRPGGLDDRGGHRVHRGERVERGHAVGTAPGERDEQDRRRPRHDGGDESHLAPVERVGEHAAVEAGHDHGEQREERDARDGEGGSGEAVDIEAHGHDGHLAADAGDGLTGPEPRERRARLEGSEVGERIAPLHGFTGRAADGSVHRRRLGRGLRGSCSGLPAHAWLFCAAAAALRSTRSEWWMAATSGCARRRLLNALSP